MSISMTLRQARDPDAMASELETIARAMANLTDETRQTLQQVQASAGQQLQDWEQERTALNRSWQAQQEQMEARWQACQVTLESHQARYCEMVRDQVSLLNLSLVVTVFLVGALSGALLTLWLS